MVRKAGKQKGKQTATTKRIHLFTLTEEDFQGFDTALIGVRGEFKPDAEEYLALQGRLAELKPCRESGEILSTLIPKAIARKYGKAIPDDFELSQIEISGELSAKLFGVGASGTVTITYTKQKSTQ